MVAATFFSVGGEKNIRHTCANDIKFDGMLAHVSSNTTHLIDRINLRPKRRCVRVCLGLLHDNSPPLCSAQRPIFGIPLGRENGGKTGNFRSTSFERVEHLEIEWIYSDATKTK